MAKILLLDNSAEHRQKIHKCIAPAHERNITSAATAEEALELMRKEQFDILLVKYNLGEGKTNGIQFLNQIPSRDKRQPVLMFVSLEESEAMHSEDEYEEIKKRQIKREIGVDFLKAGLMIAMNQLHESLSGDGKSSTPNSLF